MVVRSGRKEQRTIDRRRTHNRGLHARSILLAAVDHNLVDVAMEGFAGKVDELVDAFEVVEDLVRVLA